MNNPSLDIIISRRRLLGGMATGAAALLAKPALSFAAVEKPTSSLTFSEISHGIDDNHHVAAGHDADILIRWGDALTDKAPAFTPGKLDAAAQAQQFGYNCDFVAYMPLPQGSDNSEHGLLCVNHEYANPGLMVPGDLTGADIAAIMEAHGHSVVEIRKTNGKWAPVEGTYNRRITATTAIELTGPAAGHDRLKTSADASGTKVFGTIANCSGGTTPWGTVLSGEENIQHFFGGETTAREQATAQRFGFGNSSEHGWEKFQPRFDMSQNPNEPNRFGWVVELDPYNPSAPPKKRTALGRFRHEAATTVLNKDGRVVVYMGDDGEFEFIYKFVTDKTYKPHDRAANMDMLDHGTLHVAQFMEDGKLRWHPLIFGQGRLTAENGFNSQADVVIEARRAATLLGATPMDRPEDVETNPINGRVYAMLTNNDSRKQGETDAANPRAKNKGGQVIEMIPPGGAGRDADHAAAEYTWEFFIIAGDPAERGTLYNANISQNGWFACPDNCAFDAQGRIWIATDQGKWQGQFKTGDGLYAADVTGAGRANPRFFYRVPVGAEMCGPCFTPDNKTLFVAVQHPGENSTFDNPTTRWPDFKAGVPPRPSVVAITKKDGGIIGS